MIEHIYIKDETSLNAIIAEIFGADLDQVGVIGIDIETAARDQKDAFRALRGWISTIQIKVADRLPMIIDAQEIGVTGLGIIGKIVADPRILKVAHNAKFEIGWFLHHLKVEPRSFFDTMLASKIIAGGDIAADHSLEGVAFTFAGIELDKTEQKSDWSVRPLSSSQIEYALRDAEVVLDIYPEQVERLRADDLLRVAVIDFDAIKPIAKAELNGMHLDEGKWTALLRKNEAKLAEIERELDEMLSAGVDWMDRNPAKIGTRPRKPEKPVNPLRMKINKGKTFTANQRASIEAAHEKAMKLYEFEMNKYMHELEAWNLIPDEIPGKLNPRSVQQMQRVLKNVTGIAFQSTREQFLTPFAGKYPVIAKLLEHRGFAKLVSSYGQNLLDERDENGRVHTDFDQIKDTGRMGSREPNLQQIPHDEEFRRAFTAPPGRKMIVADYSQIELRVLAEFGGDETFVGDFNSGIDMHIKGASRFNRVPVEDVSPEMRHGAKRTNFGVVFGIGDEKLGIQINATSRQAGALKAAYFKTYPGNATFLSLGNHQARTHLFARTSSGRIQRFTHDGSRGQIAAIGRNGQNMPIQGTAADMMKRALFLIDEYLTEHHPTAMLINIVHDEIVAEADEHEAEEVARIIKHFMEVAGREYIVRVPVIAETAVLDDWVK